MSQLVKILLAGFAAFMLLAMVQEWDFFYSSWFGEPAAAPELSFNEQEAATDAVRLTLSLMRHFYASGGDPRFAERIPASDGVLAEMQADIDYLARNRRRQEPELKKLEVLAIDPVDQRRVEIRTRELWSVRFFWLQGQEESEPARIQVLYGRYMVARGPRGWRVEGWAFMEPAAPEAAEG